MDKKSDNSLDSVDTIDSVIQQDKHRYERKGYGAIFAVLFSILGFLIFPNILYYWIALMDGYTPRQINNVILISVHIIAYVIGNLEKIIIYKMKHPFFERYRIRNTPWPWESDPVAWQIKQKIVFKNWLLNCSIGSMMCIIDSYASDMQRTDLGSFPSAFEFLWQIVLSMVLEDTVFYWVHRTLHHPKLYPLIHKKHHEFYTTVSMSAEYAHPIEYAFGNVIPVFIAAKLLGSRMHLVTIATWLIMRVGETVDGHSGYEFSWSPYRMLPFASSSEYHNYHHSHNIGNYESWFSVWDTICGTNKSFNKFRKEVENEERLSKMRKQYQNNKKNE